MVYSVLGNTYEAVLFKTLPVLAHSGTVHARLDKLLVDSSTSKKEKHCPWSLVVVVVVEKYPTRLYAYAQSGEVPISLHSPGERKARVPLIRDILNGNRHFLAARWPVLKIFIKNMIFFQSPTLFLTLVLIDFTSDTIKHHTKNLSLITLTKLSKYYLSELFLKLHSGMSIRCVMSGKTWTLDNIEQTLWYIAF
jgi:hypothetical protein